MHIISKLISFFKHSAQNFRHWPAINGLFHARNSVNRSITAILMGVYKEVHRTIGQFKSIKYLYHMNFSIIIVLLTSSFVQSMTVREYHQNLQLKDEQKIEQKVDRKNNSPFKAALESFTKCQKLRAKLMIKYRNRPRLLRRIKNLTLEC